MYKCNKDTEKYFMSDKDKEEVDIIEYTKGTRMDDAYYFFRKPKENSENEKDDTT